MDEFELQPVTDAGGRFVALAEEHAADFATRADEHDRDGSFPVENFEAMKASGFTAAPVPEHLGGMGMNSVHDLACGLNRLARGDGSTAIAVNMHLAVTWITDWNRRVAETAGDTPRQAVMEGFLAMVGGGLIAMAIGTEAGTTIGYPMTEATKVEGGWSVSGRKAFGTLSPVADIMMVACRARADDGAYDVGFAVVPRGTPGATLLDDWDALGMRASGSGNIVLEDCVLPEHSFLPSGRWGVQGVGDLLIATAGNAGLLGSFLGIAETARDLVRRSTRTRTKQPSGNPIAHRYGIQHAVAEMEMDVATCRALLDWSGRLLDRTLVERPPTEVTVELLHALNAQIQCTKLVVNRKAVDIVDKAMQISGGAGYLTSSPLSRLYRDVRAGPFMQPLSPNEAYEYIGRQALGLDPTIQT